MTAKKAHSGLHSKNGTRALKGSQWTNAAPLKTGLHSQVYMNIMSSGEAVNGLTRYISLSPRLKHSGIMLYTAKGQF